MDENVVQSSANILPSDTVVSEASASNELVVSPSTEVKPKSNKSLIIVLIVAGIILICCTCSIVGTLFVNNTLDAIAQDGEDEKARREFLNSTYENSNASETVDQSPSDVTVSSKPDFSNMPGTTICDKLLCSDIWDNVEFLTDVYANCTDVSLKDTQLLIKASDNKSWSESWILKGCDSEYKYEIAYTADPTGGTNFSIEKKF
jgi:hypothetical protein